MRKKILIIAPNDKHLSSFMKHIHEIKDDNYIVDHFALSHHSNDDPFSEKFYIKKHFANIFYGKYLAFMTKYADLYLSFKKITKSYDLINIHFVTIDSFFLLPLLKKKANKIMLTPWGSDALRVSNKIIVNCLKKLYGAADYVSLADIRFRQDVINKFGFTQKKIVDLSYGASMIDYIAENPLSPTDAKKEIKLEDYFVMTVGYNRSPMQNHINIIAAVAACKNKLPHNLILLFPFTYNGSIEPYKSQLIELLEKHQIKSIFYESFLENEKLNNIIYATDVFIHMQESDANSASLQEYILAGKTVINGSWLKYDQLEKISIPYYTAKDKNSIQATLQEVIDNKFISKTEGYHADEIKKFGWKKKSIEWNQFYSQL